MCASVAKAIFFPFFFQVLLGNLVGVNCFGSPSETTLKSQPQASKRSLYVLEIAAEFPQKLYPIVLERDRCADRQASQHTYKQIDR